MGKLLSASVVSFSSGTDVGSDIGSEKDSTDADSRCSVKAISVESADTFSEWRCIDVVSEAGAIAFRS